MHILIITLSYHILIYLLLQHLTTLLNTFKYFDYMHMYCFRCGTMQIVILRVLILLCTSIVHNSTKGMPPAPPCK